MPDDRSLRTTFDSAAALYQQARPDYPEELYDALVEAAGLASGARLLEVGCATGKATLPLACRGFTLTCVEPGPALAALARANLAAFPDVEVVDGTFEELDASARPAYDVVLAATSWHWVDPHVRYRRAWELLRPGGHLVFWSASHVFPVGGDPIFDELQAYHASGVPGYPVTDLLIGTDLYL